MLLSVFIDSSEGIASRVSSQFIREVCQLLSLLTIQNLSHLSPVMVRLVSLEAARGVERVLESQVITHVLVRFVHHVGVTFLCSSDLSSRSQGIIDFHVVTTHDRTCSRFLLLCGVGSGQQKLLLSGHGGIDARVVPVLAWFWVLAGHVGLSPFGADDAFQVIDAVFEFGICHIVSV